MAQRIGKYKVSKREAALSAADGILENGLTIQSGGLTVSAGAVSTVGATNLGTTEVMSAGAGITAGSGTVIKYGVLRVGKIITTQIFIELTGLSSGSDADDIIGVAGASGCSIGQVTTAINGTITAGTIQCLEIPAGGSDQVDLWYADNNAGVEDAAVTTLTSQVNLTNTADNTLGVSGGFIVDVVLPADKYLYLVCGDAGNAVYTKGKYLITLYGTV